MPVRDVEGIVLRQYGLGEADRIIVLLTREQGQLRGVAKGVRRPASRLAACVEPLNHVKVAIYQREGADLSRIRGAELIHSFLGRNPSLDRLYGFSFFAELAQEFVPESSPNPLFFRLLLASLEAGERKGVGKALVCYYQLWSLRLSGLLPDYDYCPHCGACVNNADFYAWVEAGKGVCVACSGGKGLLISADASRMIQQSGKLGPEAFASIGWETEPVRSIQRLTELLIALHLQKPLKSLDPLREVLSGG